LLELQHAFLEEPNVSICDVSSVGRGDDTVVGEIGIGDAAKRALLPRLEEALQTSRGQPTLCICGDVEAGAGRVSDAERVVRNVIEIPPHFRDHVLERHQR